MKTLLALLLLIPSLGWGLDKDELKEELEYWKSLLDDELISQEDYDLKKNELLNFKPQTSINSNTKITPEEVPGHDTYFPLDRGRTFSIQNTLNNLGYEITVDGVAGKETNQALDIWKLCNNYKNYNHKAHTKLLKSTTFCPNDFEPIYELTQNPDFFIEPKYNSKIKSLNKGTPFMIIGKKDDYWKIKLEKEVVGIGAKTDVGFISTKNFLFINQVDNQRNIDSNFDVAIKFSNSIICKYPYLVGLGSNACKSKNILYQADEGDEVKIIWWQINAHCKNVIKVIHEKSKTEGFININNLSIRDKSKFFDMDSVLNPDNEYSKCKISTYSAKNYKNKVIYSNSTDSNNLNNSNDTKINSYSSKKDTNSKNSNNKNNKCSGLKSEQNILYKGITGYWSEKDACIKITNYTDTKLCMRLKFEEDKQYVKTDKMINMYKEEAYKRNITCIDGTAFKSDNSNTQSILSQKKLEKKLEKKMQCTARRTEWRTLCKTGDYRLVNGVSCYGRWYDNLHC